MQALRMQTRLLGYGRRGSQKVVRRVDVTVNRQARMAKDDGDDGMENNKRKKSQRYKIVPFSLHCQS